MDVAPATLPRAKEGVKINEINNIYVGLFTDI